MEGNVGRGGVGRNLLKVSPRLARGIDVIDSIRPNLRNLVEAAHTNAVSPRGIGQKTSDFSAIPLCAAHHRENLDSYHRLGERWFAQVHQIRLPELVQALNSRYGRQVP